MYLNWSLPRTKCGAKKSTTKFLNNSFLVHILAPAMYLLRGNFSGVDPAPDAGSRKEIVIQFTVLNWSLSRLKAGVPFFQACPP